MKTKYTPHGQSILAYLAKFRPSAEEHEETEEEVIARLNSGPAGSMSATATPQPAEEPVAEEPELEPQGEFPGEAEEPDADGSTLAEEDDLTQDDKAEEAEVADEDESADPEGDADLEEGEADAASVESLGARIEILSDLIQSLESLKVPQTPMVSSMARRTIDAVLLDTALDRAAMVSSNEDNELEVSVEDVKEVLNAIGQGIMTALRKIADFFTSIAQTFKAYFTDMVGKLNKDKELVEGMTGLTGEFQVPKALVTPWMFGTQQVDRVAMHGFDVSDNARMVAKAAEVLVHQVELYFNVTEDVMHQIKRGRVQIGDLAQKSMSARQAILNISESDPFHQIGAEDTSHGLVRYNISKTDAESKLPARVKVASASKADLLQAITTGLLAAKNSDLTKTYSKFSSDLKQLLSRSNDFSLMFQDRVVKSAFSEYVSGLSVTSRYVGSRTRNLMKVAAAVHYIVHQGVAASRKAAA